MKNHYTRQSGPFSLANAIQSRISTYLYEIYANDDGLLGDLDRWTQRRITDENMAKLSLVLESDDPAETCYKDLIREIDAEAESGIFLVNADSDAEHLRLLAEDPGVSGFLDGEVAQIAPVVFPDETLRSRDDLDLVWITIKAYHDRAHVDARVSEIIMGCFLDSADPASDMADALRSLLYSYHEDIVRHRCNLSSILDERETRDLSIMVSELMRRSGNYQERADQIRLGAETN
jgi:hypothetical protein